MSEVDVDVTRSVEWQSGEHPRGSGPQGGQFVAKGAKAQPPAKRVSKPRQRHATPHQAGQPAAQHPTTPKKIVTLKRGANNDPQQVRELQIMLQQLGLSSRGPTGYFDASTQASIQDAQRKLGMKPTGTASAALVRKLMAAQALSPCIKRSGNLIGSTDLVRAEFPALTAALDAGELDDEEAPVTEIMRYQRWWPLDDIEISRSHAGGRTVTAYATVFDTSYPVSDQYGDYDEVVERSAFNKWLADGGIERAMCLYNHGYTVHGTPSDAYSVPLGQPLEITPDGRGLKTITRYNQGPDIDRVLEAINNGAIRGQSFRGRIVRSSPNNRRYGLGRDGVRTTVTRHELGLTDYGPTPMPVNSGAEILAVRSYLSGLDGGQVAELIRKLAPTTPEEPETPTPTSEQEDGTEEPPAEALRSADFDMADIRRTIGTARILREGPRNT